MRGRKSRENAEGILKRVRDVLDKYPNVVYIQDVWKLAAMDEHSFYKYYPVGSAGYEEVYDILDSHKMSLKQKIRDKMFESDNPTALIALYKLLGNESERNILNNRPQEVKLATDGDTKINLVIN